MESKLALRPDKAVIGQMVHDDKNNLPEIMTPLAKKYKGIIEGKNLNIDETRFEYLKEKHIK